MMLYRVALQGLFITLISLGIFFRLAHLDHKIYWYDEAFTSLRAAGYTEAEVVQHFANSGVVQVAEVQQYQHPRSDRHLADTLHSLATEDTQHPPLYYTLAHFWSRWMGSSIASSRLLPALLGLLGFPAMYWLAQELFVRTGAFATAFPVWLSVGLFAISPFQVAYAQEARQYSLWTTLTLLSTAALLRAMRRATPWSWLLYALTVAASLNTFLFSGLVCLAHGIYVLSCDDLPNRPTKSRQFWPYLTATAIGVLFFFPWAWILTHNLGQAHTVTSWTEYRLPPEKLTKAWISGIGQIFYDRNQSPFDQRIHFGLAVLVAYAFYRLIRTAPPQVSRLILLLTVVPVLPLVLPDLVVGGMRSTYPRYFIPALLGIQLAVVYLLSWKMHQAPRQGRWLVALICCAGVISCLTLFPARTWWSKNLNQANLAIGEVLNQSARPLLVSDAETGDLLSLSYYLPPQASLLIRPRCYTCRFTSPDGFDASFMQLSNDFDAIFLYHPRPLPPWLQSLNDGNQPFQFELLLTESTEKNHVLWRIVNK